MIERRADRDAALAQSEDGFVVRGLEHSLREFAVEWWMV